jgi:hypothetical protein
MATHHQPEETSTNLYNQEVFVPMLINIAKRLNGFQWEYTINTNGGEISLETEDGNFHVGVNLRLLNDRPAKKPVKTLPGTTVSSLVILKN